MRYKITSPSISSPTAAGFYLLAEGRLINLAAAYGHPPGVMDMSFANQALSVRYIVEQGRSLKKSVYSVPVEIDRRVAAEARLNGPGDGEAHRRTGEVPAQLADGNLMIRGEWLWIC